LDFALNDAFRKIFVRNLIFILYIASDTEQLKTMIHSLTTLYDLITNIFLNTLFSAKSNDYSDD